MLFLSWWSLLSVNTPEWMSGLYYHPLTEVFTDRHFPFCDSELHWHSLFFQQVFSWLFHYSVSICLLLCPPVPHRKPWLPWDSVLKQEGRRQERRNPERIDQVYQECKEALVSSVTSVTLGLMEEITKTWKKVCFIISESKYKTGKWLDSV